MGVRPDSCNVATLSDRESTLNITRRSSANDREFSCMPRSMGRMTVAVRRRVTSPSFAQSQLLFVPSLARRPLTLLALYQGLRHSQTLHSTLGLAAAMPYRFSSNSKVQ
eukprot:COSAG01_NODE_3419_length_6120_cov_9.941538_3_plen_109_part_00